MTFCAVAQTPHYVDGEHNNEYEESEELKLLHTSCEDLLTQFPSDWKQPLYPYEASTADEAIQNELSALQHPQTKCSESRLLLFSLHSDCGFGAEMHWLTVALYAAMETKRTLVLLENKSWIYASEPFCPKGNGTFSCYFEPISSCTVFNDDDLNELLRGQSLDEIPIFTTKELHALEDERVVRYTPDLQQQLDFPFFRSMPARYKTGTSKKKIFWFRSQLVYFMMALRPRVVDYIESRRVALQIHEYDLLGVHARRGDKVLGSAINNKEMDAIAFERSFAISKAIAVQCGFDGVYTATKDPKYLAYIEERVSAGDGDALVWLHDKSMQRQGDGWSTDNLLKGKLDNSQEGLDVITDMFLLADMRGFLGRFESNLSRLVAEMGMAQYTMEVTAAFGRAWMVFP